MRAYEEEKLSARKGNMGCIAPLHFGCYNLCKGPNSRIGASYTVDSRTCQVKCIKNEIRGKNANKKDVRSDISLH